MPWSSLFSFPLTLCVSNAKWRMKPKAGLGKTSWCSSLDGLCSNPCICCVTSGSLQWGIEGFLLCRSLGRGVLLNNRVLDFDCLSGVSGCTCSTVNTINVNIQDEKHLRDARFHKSQNWRGMGSFAEDVTANETRWKVQDCSKCSEEGPPREWRTVAFTFWQITLGSYQLADMAGVRHSATFRLLLFVNPVPLSAPYGMFRRWKNHGSACRRIKEWCVSRRKVNSCGLLKYEGQKQQYRY